MRKWFSLLLGLTLCLISIYPALAMSDDAIVEGKTPATREGLQAIFDKLNATYGTEFRFATPEELAELKRMDPEVNTGPTFQYPKSLEEYEAELTYFAAVINPKLDAIEAREKARERSPNRDEFDPSGAPESENGAWMDSKDSLQMIDGTSQYFDKAVRIEGGDAGFKGYIERDSAVGYPVFRAPISAYNNVMTDPSRPGWAYIISSGPYVELTDVLRTMRWWATGRLLTNYPFAPVVLRDNYTQYAYVYANSI